MKLDWKQRLTLGLMLHTCVGCVQIATDNDVLNATAAVISVVYLQQDIDQQKAKSAQQDILKATDPKVKQLDQVIE